MKTKRRFVVRSLEGWKIKPGSDRRSSSHGPGLTVWVADEALYGKEMRVWRSEDHHRGAFQRSWIWSQARSLARDLNREHRQEASKK